MHLLYCCRFDRKFFKICFFCCWWGVGGYVFHFLSCKCQFLYGLHDTRVGWVVLFLRIIVYVTCAKWVYLTICTQSRYTHVPRRIRQGTYMYPVVYDRVHTCTWSYTSGYTYVLCRIRQGTHMYPDVYVRVHISKNTVSFSKNLYVGSKW